jgi:hypothetical protein
MLRTANSLAPVMGRCRGASSTEVSLNDGRQLPRWLGPSSGGSFLHWSTTALLDTTPKPPPWLRRRRLVHTEKCYLCARSKVLPMSPVARTSLHYRLGLCASFALRVRRTSVLGGTPVCR